MKCKIQIKNKQATLKINQLTLFQNCQLLHAQGRSGQDYYLIFHKGRYINLIKVSTLNPESFISKAIEHGLTVAAPHHAIYSLISDQTFTLTPLNKMLHISSNDDKQLEKIIILTYFDQHVPKEKIVDHFVECFRTHRRNGKMQLAFQVISLLKNYDPENQFASDILSTLTFQDYQIDNLEYYSFIPLQLEQLEQIYVTENRQLELSILSTNQLFEKFSEHSWRLFHQTLTPYPDPVKTRTLIQLFKTQTELIKHTLFADALLKNVGPKSYLKIILHPDFNQSINQTTFIDHLTDIDQPTKLDIFKNKQAIFIERSKPFSADQKEVATRLIVEAALQSETIDDILSWLTQFEQPFTFQQQLVTMKGLIENPDQQEKLADLYQKFNFLSGAIECLKWEIELHPKDEAIFKKLIHLLKETKNIEEADAYQQQWVQQMKYSN